MVDIRKHTGNLGEKLASHHLAENGYEILHRNYRCPNGEIDIIARDGEHIVFVEVRTRRSRQYGAPEESVNQAKQAKLIELAEYFLQENCLHDQPWRIDVVAIEMGRNNKVTRMNLIKNAIC